ncbi:MAG TPA: hypothetical protein VJ577_08205 [Burkholderiaceae bacterium]|nr:hypothetical protein [Burkholderiaceae bacterium]
MSACADCRALDGRNVAVSPHAELLLHSQAGINFGATASGHIEYYVCHACGTQWERIIARSEPNAVWRHTDRQLDR